MVYKEERPSIEKAVDVIALHAYVFFKEVELC